jgi:hypothetical protein
MEQAQAPFVQLPLTWIDVDKTPINFVNAVVTQLDDFGDFLVTFGQATPPALTGANPEENRKQLERIAYVPVRPIFRISMSRARLEQFIANLQQMVAVQDQFFEAKRQMEGGN